MSHYPAVGLGYGNEYGAEWPGDLPAKIPAFPAGSERLQVLGELALYAAHEVKTMLTVIRGAQAAIEHQIQTGRAAEPRLSDVLQAALSRAMALLDEILFFATERRVRRTPIVVSDLVQRVARMMRAIAEGSMRSTRVLEEYDDAVPPVWGDESLLEASLTNLAFNGLQALGTRGGELAFAVAAEPSFVAVRIRNSGPAVSPAFLEHVASLPTSPDRAGGTGLGLIIARTGIEAHNGRVTLRQVGAHSIEACVTLPAEDEPA